jgi:hypothetical protein
MIKKGRGRHAEPRYGDDHWAKKKPELIPVGERHHASKLSDDIVRDLRKSKETSTYLAKKYGVSITTICYARAGKTWGHVQSSFLDISSAEELK